MYCRPGRTGANATGRGVLSMQGLSYGVVRVDTENSLTSLTLQDCGQILPGGILIFHVLIFSPSCSTYYVDTTLLLGCGKINVDSVKIYACVCI